MQLNRILCGMSVAGLLATQVLAAEIPIGEPVSCGGMEVAAVYLQPIEMDPPGVMRLAKDSDIHLEADISALEANVTGFQEGAWVPYLNVNYEIAKKGSKKVIKGHAHPMVANDGAHYGDNIKLDGPGAYTLKFIITPPDGKSNFGRHVDKETGVGEWFKECVAEYAEFTFAGTGKKGGY